MKVDSDQFKRYCYASILDYLKAKQIAFEPNGQEGYYHLADHDSLVIVKEGTGHYQTDTFFWNSRGLSGNLYRFITEYMGVPKKDFVDEVVATLGKDAGPANDYQGDDGQPFDETQWSDSGYHKQINAFMTIRCGLSQDVVDRLFDLDILRQLANKNGALMWRNAAHEIVGASQILNQDSDHMSTRTCRDSKTYYGLNFAYRCQRGDDYTLLVFEDPLRALAYYQLLANSGVSGAYRFLSVGGAATRLPAIENFVNDWGVPKKIRLCIDNGTAGLIMAAKFYLGHSGDGDIIKLQVNDVTCQVATEFDHPGADFANFIEQNLAGNFQPQALTYPQLLHDYDDQHGEGSAQQLIDETPGMVIPRIQVDQFTDDNIPF